MVPRKSGLFGLGASKQCVCVWGGLILHLETLGTFCPQDDKVRERPLLSLWSVEGYFGAVDMLHMAMVPECWHLPALMAAEKEDRSAVFPAPALCGLSGLREPSFEKK